MLTILKFGEDILKRQAKEIGQIDGRIADLVKQMIETMYHAPTVGVGLAAPQIGEPIRLAVMDTSTGANPADLLVLINPVLTVQEDEETKEEGCLSFPGINLAIARASRVLLRAVDLQGQEFERELQGFAARVVQHELDHLNGTLIVDRVSPLKRKLVKQEIKKLKKRGEW